MRLRVLFGVLTLAGTLDACPPAEEQLVAQPTVSAEPSMSREPSASPPPSPPAVSSPVGATKKSKREVPATRAAKSTSRRGWDPDCKSRIIAGRIGVRIKEGATMTLIALRHGDTRYERAFPNSDDPTLSRWYTVYVEDGAELQKAAEYRGNSDVEYAEAHYTACIA
jgi:hypothetical protein